MTVSDHRRRRARVREPAKLAVTPRARPGLPPLRSIALVALGGMAGALARVGFALRLPVDGGTFPWTTLGENLAGAFLLGALLTLLLERLPPGGIARPLFGTGLLGAFTTFATWMAELSRLLADKQVALAVMYGLASLAGGLISAALGVASARAAPALLHRRRRPGTQR